MKIFFVPYAWLRNQWFIKDKKYRSKLSEYEKKFRRGVNEGIFGGNYLIVKAKSKEDTILKAKTYFKKVGKKTATVETEFIKEIKDSVIKDYEQPVI